MDLGIFAEFGLQLRLSEVENTSANKSLIIESPCGRHIKSLWSRYQQSFADEVARIGREIVGEEGFFSKRDFADTKAGMVIYTYSRWL